MDIWFKVSGLGFRRPETWKMYVCLLLYGRMYVCVLLYGRKMYVCLLLCARKIDGSVFRIYGSGVRV